MNILFILNGAPYGSEATYNGLRLAGALSKRSSNIIRLYLMGDSVGTAKRGQKLAANHGNLEAMFHVVAHANDSQVAACGSCLDARGLTAEDLTQGVHRGSLEELADWTEWSDKVLVF